MTNWDYALSSPMVALPTIAITSFLVAAPLYLLWFMSRKQRKD